MGRGTHPTQVSPGIRFSRARLLRALIAFSLSAAFAAAAASSASAVSVTPDGDTITPTQASFGRVSIYHRVSRTFTITKGSEPDYFLIPGDLGPGDFVSNSQGVGFGSSGFSVSTNCPDFLDFTTPSCTMTVTLRATPGPNKGFLLTNFDLGGLARGTPSAPDLEAPLSAIGILPRSSYYCWTRNGHPLHKRYWKYCQKKK